MSRSIERLQAEFSRRLRHFDRTQAYEREGALSAASWLRWKCRMTHQVASWRVRTARLLDELPQTAQAFAAGDIGFQHVTVVARSALQVGTAVVADAEPILLEAARKVDPKDLATVTAHLRHCLDPGGALAEANDDYERSQLHLSQSLDGVYYLNGHLDAERGCILRTALEALMGKPVRGDGRSYSQRQAEALVEMARRQLDSGELPQVAGNRPHLLLMASPQTLQREPGAEPGRLGSGELIHAETVRRLACDCVLTPLLVDAAGQPLAMGRGKRLIRGRQRVALDLRDGGCRFSGCDRPPAWSEPHHLEHWADGGASDLPNLLLLCRRHHVMVHEGGWQLEMDAAGEVTVVPRWAAPLAEPP